MADSVLHEAHERFKESQDGSSFNREEAYEDIRFARLSDQWPEEIRKQRQMEGRPCLTINRLPAFIRQVVNDSRQNKPGIKVHPVDNGADVDTAEVIGGLVRSIERHSNADIAYDTAIDHAVTNGFGFFRIGIDYLHEDSFNLEAKIERIPNPLMVHWDTNSTSFDASDWDYAFVSEFLTEDQFEARYPDAQKVSFEGDTRGATNHWLEEDKVRVAEYWDRSEGKRKILQVRAPDGSLRVFREDSLKDIARQTLEAGNISKADEEDLIRAYFEATGQQIVREREASFYEVKRRIISGSEVLEEDPWPGSMIPICPVWGDEIFLDGRRHFRSMIRDARDPQSMFNFWRSATTELVALAPKAPFLMEEGALPTDDAERQKWAYANNRSYPYLLYQRNANVPQRQPFAGVPAGAIQEALNAADDMKSITGIYDAGLGARSNETSGRAILARQREGDVSNFHYIDNLARAIRYAGQCLVEIIPSIYGPMDAIRILGEDQKENVVKVTMEDGGSTQPGIDGQERLYNLSVGKYDVTVQTGPSYSTQREETREFLLEIVTRQPDMLPFIADIVFENMDFPGADKIAERAKYFLPPQIQQQEGIQPPGPLPGQVPPNPNGQGGFPPQ